MDGWEWARGGSRIEPHHGEKKGEKCKEASGSKDEEVCSGTCVSFRGDTPLCAPVRAVPATWSASLPVHLPTPSRTQALSSFARPHAFCAGRGVVVVWVVVVWVVVWMGVHVGVEGVH